MCLQQDNKTDYMNEYIKTMQDQIASLKNEVMFLREEVKEKDVFIEQLNNSNNKSSSVLCSALGQNLNFQNMFWDKPLSLK